MKFLIASICEVIVSLSAGLFTVAIPSLLGFISFSSFFLFGPVVGVLISIVALFLWYISVGYGVDLELWMSRKLGDVEEDRSDDHGGE
ncbi:hypothetical protein ACQU0X_27335 [Pseudovibrio ascidiaceicola]|uniref:hypothetical protein n=1 Tax=Pseudovibrio ascidiaceicola TaxID=285279 RepID=UPI003D36D3F9